MSMNLVQRAKHTQKTLDLWKGRKFKDWKVDCIGLTKAHARHMGHPLKVPRYHDAKTAADALRSVGCKTLGEAMDKFYRRIATSEILVGDLVEMPGANGFSGLTVALGNGRVLGFHEEVQHCDVLQPLMISGAWRIGEFPDV